MGHIHPKRECYALDRKGPPPPPPPPLQQKKDKGSYGLFCLLFACCLIVLLPFSALDTVGFDTMTGVTPEALVMASKCTKPIRPIPITPTFTTSLVSTFSTFMDKLVVVTDELELRTDQDDRGVKACEHPSTELKSVTRTNKRDMVMLTGRM